MQGTGAAGVRADDAVRAAELADELLREPLGGGRVVHPDPIAGLVRCHKRGGVVAASAGRVALCAVVVEPRFSAKPVGFAIADWRRARRERERERDGMRVAGRRDHALGDTDQDPPAEDQIRRKQRAFDRRVVLHRAEVLKQLVPIAWVVCRERAHLREDQLVRVLLLVVCMRMIRRGEDAATALGAEELGMAPGRKFEP